MSDDPAPPASQRSASRAVAAIAATLVLALAAPVAWASVATGGPAVDQPAATPAAKAALPGPEAADDDEDGDGPPPGDGDDWVATNA